MCNLPEIAWLLSVIASRLQKNIGSYFIYSDGIYNCGTLVKVIQSLKTFLVDADFQNYRCSLSTSAALIYTSVYGI